MRLMFFTTFIDSAFFTNLMWLQIVFHRVQGQYDFLKMFLKKPNQDLIRNTVKTEIVF